MEPLTVTIEEAARIVGIGRDAAYRLVKSGEWESIPVGPKQRRISRKWLMERFGVQSPAPVSPAAVTLQEAPHAQ
jgi:excisionase family DNA binding protein